MLSSLQLLEFIPVLFSFIVGMAHQTATAINSKPNRGNINTQLAATSTTGASQPHSADIGHARGMLVY